MTALSDIDLLPDDVNVGDPGHPVMHERIHAGMKALKTLAQDTDTNTVKLTGGQTIAGVKVFSSSPTVPTPSGGTDVANKTYADTKEPAITIGTSAQYWRGDKTFQTLNATAVGLGNVTNTAQQPLDATLTALAGVTTAADKLIYATGVDTFTTADLSSTARTLLDDTSTSAMRTTLGVAIGSNVQAWDADLDTLAGLTATTDNFIVSVSSAWASRTPSQVRTTLALVIGTNVQAWDADLDTIAGLTATTDNFIQSKGSAWASRTIAQVKSDLGLTGTNSGDQTITLTSDVTGAGTGSFATTIANNAVTNAKAAQMAAHTFKGNNTGSTANALDLTATQLTAELNAFVGDAGSGGTKGLVIAPTTGDGSKFLRGDATWVTIPGGGDALTSSTLAQFAATSSLQLKNTISDETGSGALVFATSPALVTPTGIVKGDVGLGNVSNLSPASLAADSAFTAAFQPLDSDLTTIAGLTATTDNFIISASSAWASRTPAQARTSLGLVIGTNVQAWDADLDTWATKTAPSGVVIGTTDTQTLTNKTITNRVGTTASSATPAINTDNFDVFTITALAAAITSMTSSLTGTPTDGQRLVIRIKDNGTTRAITWGASFQSSGVASLLANTVINKTHTVTLIWDAAVSKFVCMSVDMVGY